MAAMAMAERLARAQALYNAFVHVVPPAELERLIGAPASNATSALKGRSLAVKANISVRGWPTTCASRALANYRAPYDATCVERLRAHGAMVVASTNMDEFGMGSDGTTSAHGPTRSPWGPTHSPGGSSSGSAVAVACSAVFAALGSDTGGSVRLPAARCGVVGLVPSRGVVSRHGLVAYASSLDTVGVLARSVRDAAVVLQCIAGPDGRDATCDRSLPALLAAAPKATLRIGIPVALLTEDVCASTLKAWSDTARLLADDGADVVDVDLHGLADCLAAYYVIALAEAGSNLARYDGVRYGAGLTGDGAEFAQSVAAARARVFGAEVQKRLLMGALALSVDSTERFYKRASRFRDHLRAQLRSLLSDNVDALLLPTAPTAMPSHHAHSGYFEDLFTVPASLAGLASLSLPVAVCPVSNAPVGMQVVALDEATCVHIGERVERLARFAPPPSLAV